MQRDIVEDLRWFWFLCYSLKLHRMLSTQEMQLAMANVARTFNRDGHRERDSQVSCRWR
jgi:hypothetical protein